MKITIVSGGSVQKVWHAESCPFGVGSVVDGFKITEVLGTVRADSEAHFDSYDQDRVNDELVCVTLVAGS